MWSHDCSAGAGQLVHLLVAETIQVEVRCIEPLQAQKVLESLELIPKKLI